MPSCPLHQDTLHLPAPQACHSCPSLAKNLISSRAVLQPGALAHVSQGEEAAVDPGQRQSFPIRMGSPKQTCGPSPLSPFSTSDSVFLKEKPSKQGGISKPQNVTKCNGIFKFMQKSIFLRKQNLTHFLSICDINH